MDIIKTKQRILALIREAEEQFKGTGKALLDIEDYVAEYLTANGVIAPPCKVGDMVYTIHHANFSHHWKPYVDELCVTEINHKCNRSGKDIGWGVVLYSIKNHTTTRYKMSNVGKTVFLSREEAEKALEGYNK